MRACSFALLIASLIGFSALGADTPKTATPKLSPKVMELIKGTPEEFIKAFDKNNDGVLTKDEVPPFLAERFDKIDTNGDGKLDKKEVAVLLAKLRERMGIAEEAKPKPAPEKSKPATETNPPTKDSTATTSPRGNPADFERLDKNADGRLTRDEVKGTPYEEPFDAIDTNKDGKIDRKEFLAYLKKGEEKK